jgi:hypothetical protein
MQKCLNPKIMDDPAWFDEILDIFVAEKNATKNEHICSMCIKINSRQTGSRNLMDPKILPPILLMTGI